MRAGCSEPVFALQWFLCLKRIMSDLLKNLLEAHTHVGGKGEERFWPGFCSVWRRWRNRAWCMWPTSICGGAARYARDSKAILFNNTSQNLQVGGKDSPYGRPSQLENNICNIPVARCVTGWSYLVDRAWNRTYLRVLGLDGGLRELWHLGSCSS